ncbi:MAG TPA: HEPN domain-containing protein [Candidatus Bilamarchaeaceae archaeon]|nr:HEPN domain-containing protein [Candidatus Bilamarchaeaceae archaeon]
MSEVERCFSDGMLKGTGADMGKALSSLKISEQNLEDAKVSAENGVFNWALIAAYTAMFHAARALLYKDGVKERSHYCLCAYIKEKYRGALEAKYLTELDVLRGQRHRIMYGDEDIVRREVEETEAHSAIEMAKGFLEAVRKLVK